MTGPGASAGKAEWRSWAKEAWAEIDVAAASRAIVRVIIDSGLVKPDSGVVVFLPMGGELDIEAAADGAIGLVTRTPEQGWLTLHPLSSPREPHRYGFAQPTADSPQVPEADVDMVIVPGLAFDRSGTRLGHGAGYFDQFLARLRPHTLLVGVAPSELVVDDLPRDPHDVVMTHLATPEGLIAISSVAPVDDLEAAALAWIEGDPDPVTRAELSQIVDSGDADELSERMGGSLQFGTAGIRGAVEAGANRMNRAVVIRTTRGLVDVLLRNDDRSHVVVGFDGRSSSRAFAEDTIGVLCAAGIPVRYFSEVAPTPLVAYAARLTGAAAAVVVTASHNPPRDNGYKVYAANGAQIVPPLDRTISEAIDLVGSAASVPRLAGGFAGEIDSAVALGPEVEDGYLDELMQFRGVPPPGESIRVVYSAMHGVGGALAIRALQRAGYADIHPVAEQFEPDGRFPTVAFPNPEEPGALDLAETLANSVDADLVLANDPDADRLAVMVPDDEMMRPLTGNQIGVLLADAALRRWSGDGVPLVINSIVSSPMLAAVAAAHGAEHAVTLTGFKWIANAALDLAAEGRSFVMGYEEALGYTMGPAVRDKDGISAAVWFADLAAEAKAAGSSVLGVLEALYRRDGLWVSHQHSLVRPGADGAAEIAGAMERLEVEGPGTLGGLAVVGTEDYRVGAEDRPRYLPATALVAYSLEDGSRVLVRPSGTEPKLKIYADVRGVLSADVDLDVAEASALEVARAAAADLAGFLGF